MDGKVQKLTERQKDCLRLVLQGLEVKEIARALAIGPAAVVERLRAARRLLDVESSREAARLLAKHEGMGTYIRHVDMPTRLAELNYELPPTSASEAFAELEQTLRLEEVSTAFVAVDPQPSARFRGWRPPWRREGERSNDLTAKERLLVSGGLTIAIALGTAIILIAIVQLMVFLIHISRHGG